MKENKWVKIAKQIIKGEDFELYVNDKGFYALRDLQGADLGDIQEREYTNLASIIDDLSLYHQDYYINDIKEVLEINLEEDKNYIDWSNYYNYIKEHKEEVEQKYSNVDYLLDELYVIIWCYDIPELNEKIREEE